MSKLVQSALHVLAHLLQIPCEIGNIIISILRVRKPSLPEPDNLTLLTILFYVFQILFISDLFSTLEILQ